ncbi:hypothetical protein FRC09_001906 [Ceratobasidium sp. 395]|nr:hypothetical protein FRC09_001906 [Ceratobasidium sp. 395]
MLSSSSPARKRKDRKKTLAEKDSEVLQLRADLAAKDRELKDMMADEAKCDQPSTAGRKRVSNPEARLSIKWQEANGGGGGGDKEIDVDMKMEAKVDVEVDAGTQKIYDCAEKVS